jgi:WD40 repeat protein
MLVLFLLLVPALAVHAQNNPPPQLTNALADLSTQVGKTVTLADLQNWTFNQQNFPDPSMGCPKPGVMYAQVITPGIQFLLTYSGKVYDYRVTLDGQHTVLCGTTDAPETIPPCPPPDDPAYLAPRLAINAQGRVVPGGIPNNVREQPGTSAKKIGEIPPAAVFTVMDGPRCSTLDKIVWWKVNFNGLQGWTPEGQSGTYWIEPVDANGQPTVLVTPTPGAAGSQRISTINASQLKSAATFMGQTAVLSPDGKTLYVATSSGIAAYDALTGTARTVGLLTAPNSTITVLAFGASDKLFATGDTTGAVQVWDVQPDQSAKSRGVFAGHTKPITALAFSPDGTLLVSGGQDGTIRIWNATTAQQLAQFNTPSSGTVMSIAFNQTGDSITVISTGETGVEVTLLTVPAAAAG